LKYPKAKTIHLVTDNLNSHRRKSLSDLYGAEIASELWDCFTVHYTPTHGSWLNQAEIEIGIFARQCLGSRRIPDLKTLRREACAWNRRMNRDRVKINWKFDRKAAAASSVTKRNPSRGQRPSLFRRPSLSRVYPAVPSRNLAASRQSKTETSGSPSSNASLAAARAS
jgi:DDE superfamily endonuclease